MIVTRRLNILSFIFFLGLLIIGASGCLKNGEDENSESPLDPTSPVLKIDDIRGFAQLYSYGSALKKNEAFRTYSMGFSWKSGQELVDDKQLKVKVDKFESYVEFTIDLDLKNLTPFPVVYNKDFNKEEEADRLKLTLNITNGSNNSIMKKSDSQNIYNFGSASFKFTLTPNEYKSLKEGMANLTASLDAELISFFGVPSGVHPVKAAIKFDFYVPTVYKSIVYFERLELNQKDVTKLLGDNDWNNSIPETGISISCNNQRVLFDYSKNSYVLSKKIKEEFFHTGESDKLKIQVLDVDYGFNGNDIIYDTLIPIRNLEGNSCIDLKMRFVDQMLIYTQFKGKVN